MADGGYATKDYAGDLPDSIQLVGSFPIRAKLYELLLSSTTKRRGAPHKQGDLLRSPKTLAPTAPDWSPHQHEEDTKMQSWCAWWTRYCPDG